MGAKEIKMFMLTYVITLLIEGSNKEIHVAGQYSLFHKLCQVLTAFDDDAFQVADLEENWEERDVVLLHRYGGVVLTENLKVQVTGVSDIYMDVNLGLTVNGQTFNGEPFGIYEEIQAAGFPAFKIFAMLNAHNQLHEICEGDEFDIGDLTVVIAELSC